MLAARAWWRYAVVNSAPPADLLRLRVLLLMLSLSMILWIFVLVLMGVGPRDQAPWGSPNLISVLRATLTPGLLFLINLSLCMTVSVLSRVKRYAIPQTLPLKRSLGLASGSLVVVWLLFAMNTHRPTQRNIGSESVCPASPRLSPSTPTGL